MKIRRYSFLHIGYHKTGTTWLQEFVFNNADFGFVSPIPRRRMIDLIVVPNPLDYSTIECYKEVHSAISKHVSPDQIPVFSAERFSGHPDSGGYDSRTIADRLFQLFEKPRVLICIREQRSMILSCYNQYIKRGGAITLESYVRVDNRIKIPLFDSLHLMYHRLIGYYFYLFGCDNVLVLPYEMFVATPAQFLQAILVFSRANVNSEDYIYRLPVSRVTNQSLSAFELEMRLLSNFAIGTRNPINQHSLVPLRWSSTEYIFDRIKSLNDYIPSFVQARLSRRNMRIVEQFTSHQFEESNTITSRLIGIDLAQFGYAT